MPVSRFEFAAALAGPDADVVFLPHFRALKAAERQTRVYGAPARTLAFLLHVDGEVRSYRFRGVGNVRSNSRGETISVEIGVSIEDRPRLIVSGTARLVPDLVRSAGAAVLRRTAQDGYHTDVELFERSIERLVAAYAKHLANTLPTS